MVKSGTPALSTAVERFKQFQETCKCKPALFPLAPVPKLFMPSLSAERQRHASKRNGARLFAFIGVFLLSWILTAVVYRHTSSNFLRAESGWFLFLSHSAPEVQHRFEKYLLTKSVHGHYAPVAFLAEFETAKLIGTHAGFWKWRQITILALLATMLFLLVRNSGHALQLSRLNASFSAVGLTAILIFQGQMREFVANPFLILQLFWLLFTVIALLSLVQMVRHSGQIFWPWIAAGASYASLHFLGLGIATVTGTAAVLAGIWLQARHRGSPLKPRHITVPLFSMLALTTLHAVIMVKFPFNPPIAPSTGWQPTSSVMAALGFIPNFAFATVRGLFSTCQRTPTPEQITQDWPIGLAIFLGLVLLVSVAFFRSLREPTTRNQARFVLQTFASVSFLTIVALIAVRLWREPETRGFADYLTGSRYLVPASVALTGGISELLFLRASATILNAILQVGLAVCAIIGNLQYATYVYPKLSPRSMISHAHAWQLIVTMAKECQKADLAIPNVPLGALVQEFKAWDLKMFEPLLRADLRSPPGTSLQFVEWIDFMNELRFEYDRDVPSFGKLRHKLDLGTQKSSR